MSATWDTYRHRAGALRDVVATIEANPGNDLPWPDVAAEAFADRDDLLVALHDLWTRRLEGRIDLMLETDDGSLDESVAKAWHAVAGELPGVRSLLDRYADHPALRAAEVSENRLVAVAAGLATLTDPMVLAARAGALFVQRVRDAGAPVAVKPLGLFARLREVLAA